MSFEEKINLRSALEAAEFTMVCFDFEGVGYAVVTELRLEWIREGRTSSKKGGKLQARIRLDKRTRAALKERANCQRLGNIDDLQAAYRNAYRAACGKDAPKNNGWMFECAVTERLAGQTWEPDSVPFWKAPDVVINGIGYQVKSNGAEYFTETSLKKAMAEMGM